MSVPAALSNYELPAAVAAMPDLYRADAIWLQTGDYDDDDAGASGVGNPEADVLALDAAIRAANTRWLLLGGDDACPVVVDGGGLTYYLRPGLTTLGDRFRNDTRPMYGAVQLRSGVVLRRCRFRPAKMLTEPVAAQNQQFMFYTGMENARGTLSDIGFVNCTFDFGSDKWTEVADIPSFIYGFAVTGVKRLWRKDCRIINSRVAEYGEDATANRGRGALIYNCDDVRIEGDIGHGICQMLFAGYLYRVSQSDCEVKSFAEAYDYDVPCWDVRISNCKFKGAVGPGDLQCIDTGGGARWLVTGIFAEDTGTPIQFYQKNVAWQTFELFYQNEAGAVPEADCGDLVTPEFMTVIGLKGIRVGLNSDGTIQPQHGSLMIGLMRASDAWTNQGYTNTIAGGLGNLVGLRRVFAYDIHLTASAAIYIGSCEDFHLEKVVLVNTKCDTSSSDAVRNSALVARQASGGDIQTVERCSGTIRDVTIIDSEGGGVSVSIPGKFILEDVTVRGFNKGYEDLDDWLTETAYAVDDLVKTSSRTYKCLVAHTSGVFATDLAALKWAVVANNAGVAIRSLGAKAGLFQIGKLDIDGGMGSADTCLTLQAIDPIVEEFRVHKAGAWNFKPRNSAEYLSSSGRVGDRWVMAQQTFKLTNYDSTVATGVSIDRRDQTTSGVSYRAILGANAMPKSAIGSASASNYTRVAIQRNGTDLSSLGSCALDATTRSAREIVNFSGDSFLNPDVLVPGDIIAVTMLRQGNGSSLTDDIYVTINFVDFVSV